MAFKLEDNGKFTPVDATKAENLSDKVLDERETRKRLLNHARIAEFERGLTGLEREMLMLFARTDKMLRNCKNDSERADIGKLAATQVYKILGGGGQLYINGQLVCDDTPKNNENNLYIPKSNK